MDNNFKFFKIVIGIILSIILIITIICLFNSCNMQVVDTTFTFDECIIYLDNDTIIKGSVDSWCDYENSDMMQVKINGITYLTHSSNIILISK